MNVGGAGGTIGFIQVAKATPDGYTLITATPSLTVNPYIQKDIAYDPIKDFEPIVLVATSPIVLVVPPDSKIKSVRDVIDMAKTKPRRTQVRQRRHRIGHAFELGVVRGDGGRQPRSRAVSRRRTALLDLIAGRLDMQFENAPSVLGQCAAATLRGVAVGSLKRSTMFPELPTIADTVSGYEATSWFGVLAPAKTPRAVVEKLNAAINKALADPAVQKQMDSLAVDLVGGTPDQFAVFLQARVAELKTVSKAANLVPE